MDRNIRWLSAGGGLRAFGLSMVLPYFALYLRNVLGVSYPVIGLLAGAIAVPALALTPIGGWVTDRVGRRPLFLVTLTVEALGILSLAASMALRSLPAVASAAALTSIGGALTGPALSAYVADFAVGSDRTVAFTFQRVGWNAGFTIGVFAGGALIGPLGFVDAGLAAGGTLLVSTAVLAYRLDPSPFDRSRAAQGVPRAEPLLRPSTRLAFGALGSDRPFLLLCVGMGLVALVENQWGVTFPLFASSVLGIPYAILGAGLALNGLVVVFGQVSTTRRAIGHRHTTLALLGLGLYVVAFVLLGGFALMPDSVVAVFFVSVFILTLGENLTSIASSTLPSNLAPPDRVGTYNGAFQAVYGIGGALAPLLGGAALAATANPLAEWLLMVAPALPAVWLVRRAASRLPAGANRA